MKNTVLRSPPDCFSLYFHCQRPHKTNNKLKPSKKLDVSHHIKIKSQPSQSNSSKTKLYPHYQNNQQIKKQPKNFQSLEHKTIPLVSYQPSQLYKDSAT